MELVPTGSWSPAASGLTVYGLGFALFALLVVMVVIARSHGQRARAITAKLRSGAAPLAPGALAVRGTVSVAPDDPDPSPPVRLVIAITRATAPGPKGTVQIVSRENARTFEVRPFELRTDRGERVRVVADQHALLGLEPARVERSADGQTRHVVEIAAEATVVVSGTLVATPRDASALESSREEEVTSVAAWTLQAAADEPMVIATQPLTAPHDTRARRAWAWAALIAAASVLMHGSLFADYYALSFDDDARVASLQDAQIGSGYYECNLPPLRAGHPPRASTCGGAWVSGTLVTDDGSRRSIVIPIDRTSARRDPSGPVTAQVRYLAKRPDIYVLGTEPRLANSSATLAWVLSCVLLFFALALSGLGIVTWTEGTPRAA